MNAIIETLGTDHKYMVKMTYLLEKQVMSLTSLSRERVNVDVLMEVIDYLTRYVSSTHHQLEDFLFARLLAKSISNEERIDVQSIESQHDVLEVLIKLCESQVEQYLLSDIEKQFTLRAQLLRSLSDFKRLEYSHMEFERDKIFPLLISYFDENDWLDAADFSETIEAQYKSGDMEELLESRERLIKTNAVIAG